MATNYDSWSTSIKLRHKQTRTHARTHAQITIFAQSISDNIIVGCVVGICTIYEQQDNFFCSLYSCSSFICYFLGNV